MEEYFVDYNGNRIVFSLTRRSKRNLNLRVTPYGEVIVSIPKYGTIKSAKEFVLKKADWILKKQEEFSKKDYGKKELDYFDGEKTYLLGRKYDLDIASNKMNRVQIQGNYININIKEKYFGDKTYTQKVYEKWIKEYSYEVLYKITQQYQYVMEQDNIPMPTIVVKKMKSRWGCCYPKRKQIVYNYNLIKAPLECVQYVVVHELSHFKYADHSKNFHEFVEKYMPDAKRRKKLLDKNYTGVV